MIRKSQLLLPPDSGRGARHGLGVILGFALLTQKMAGRVISASETSKKYNRALAGRHAP